MWGKERKRVNVDACVVAVWREITKQNGKRGGCASILLTPGDKRPFLRRGVDFRGRRRRHVIKLMPLSKGRRYKGKPTTPLEMAGQNSATSRVAPGAEGKGISLAPFSVAGSEFCVSSETFPEKEFCDKDRDWLDLWSDPETKWNLAPDNVVSGPFKFSRKADSQLPYDLTFRSVSEDGSCVVTSASLDVSRTCQMNQTGILRISIESLDDNFKWTPSYFSFNCEDGAGWQTGSTTSSPDDNSTEGISWYIAAGVGSVILIALVAVVAVVARRTKACQGCSQYSLLRLSLDLHDWPTKLLWRPGERAESLRLGLWRTGSVSWERVGPFNFSRKADSQLPYDLTFRSVSEDGSCVVTSASLDVSRTCQMNQTGILRISIESLDDNGEWTPSYFSFNCEDGAGWQTGSTTSSPDDNSTEESPSDTLWYIAAVLGFAIVISLIEAVARRAKTCQDGQGSAQEHYGSEGGEHEYEYVELDTSRTQLAREEEDAREPDNEPVQPACSLRRDTVNSIYFLSDELSGRM
ncbi:hypothetical protein C7M84_023529 [Penaeus vannamei]|uniref:Uncharacterized protein n=1 Tax=Penaeus vannamei TaxID=6689 RepID=A0A423U3L5_PENVA|nr:hypothetical protein C7M84_023529 [Penaeus vannamei]